MRVCGVLLVALLAAVPGAGVGAGAQEAGVDYATLSLDADNFNPASRCGECHIDIYALWQQSMHANALSDPAFQATFMDERIQGDERTKNYCIQCHAPAMHYNPALKLTSSLAAEGVTCDFCHSVQGVDLSNTTKPFDVVWGKLKRGPLKDSRSPVHDTKHSDVFTSGELCGGCHQMLNLNGVPIITTYAEWQEEYYEKIGENTCQDCHMPLAAGFTVSPKHLKTKRRVNLHSFPGGHSRVQLLDALKLDILEESKMYGKMKVKLGLTNSGAGHFIPTGNPLRMVIVDFSAFDSRNRLIHNEQIELSRKFVGAGGEVLATDLAVLLDASKVTKDNRIAPGETKELVFEFVAPNEKILVDVTVTYAYRNAAFPGMEREEKLIHFTKVVNKQRFGKGS